MINAIINDNDEDDDYERHFGKMLSLMLSSAHKIMITKDKRCKGGGNLNVPRLPHNVPPVKIFLLRTALVRVLGIPGKHLNNH